MTVFFILSIAFLGISIISAFLAVFINNSILKFVFILCFILALVFEFIREETVPPETIYKEKLEVVEKAEKDLHKFLNLRNNLKGI